MNIWHGFSSILNDNNHDVMINLAKHLSNVLIVFARDSSEGHLNGSICCQAAVCNQLNMHNRLTTINISRFMFEFRQ
jgi:hypothetical protein